MRGVEVGALDHGSGMPTPTAFLKALFIQPENSADGVNKYNFSLNL